MSELLSLQQTFAVNLGRLLVSMPAIGVQVVIGEVWRPQVTADYYASIGKGSKNSLHLVKLAADLVLFRDDAICADDDPAWTAMGDTWKGLHPLNRWGGDFTGTTAGDYGHVSMEYQGRK